MGLSIHYSGFIKGITMIDPLIGEMAAICNELDWRMDVYDDEIKGISFSPADSEPVFLTFNAKARLLSPMNILVKDIYDNVSIDKELMFTTSTKTQYAGIDAHIAIIKLLKYISKKYLENFKLSDEGNYWETGDEKLLVKQFERYDTALNILTGTLKDFPAKANETPQSLAKRLEAFLAAKLKSKDREKKN